MKVELKAFDRKLALEQAGGSSELARELFNMLLRDLPDFRIRINDAVRADDHSSLLQTVHKLHGAAVYCGVPALRQASNALESALKRGEYDATPVLIGCVVNEIDRVLDTDIGDQL